MPFPIYPHMLRRDCSYALANAGHDTRALQAHLGHKNMLEHGSLHGAGAESFKDCWR
jgi:type 1 fimbriae regulatory protein FimB/type 1 fimbriae regulatory protein FimE